ncbi:MAG TPA: PLP-dependent aminotransferase family protein [Trebonia sp.]|jgi:GntR family transcriptional regulator/MocR family aminotransferase|nr:PLP-dependent aminotransferase family protein [Trebonia sp.]
MTTSLPLVVDRRSGPPMAAQLSTQLRDAITSGVLVAGDRLPSTRELAVTVGVSRTVVTAAYAQLFAEGWLEGRHGSGTFVANVAPGLPQRSYTSLVPAPGPTSDLIELRPGIPWAAGIEDSAWRRAWRQAGTMAPSAWPRALGLPALRAELVHYLRRSRALNIGLDNLLITRGVAGGLALVAAALVRPGDRVGVEEPGYATAREVLRRAGAEVVPCPVDEHGVIPDAVPDGLRLLYVTPAHQYPLGGRLPVARRQALTSWARSAGGFIIEDDYDGEFRYDVGPLPALYGMDPEVVIYLGTTSKILTPVMGVGWLVARPDLVSRLAGDRVSEPAQHALHELITSGDLERHVRRMRLEYARRREVLMSLPGLRGDTAGLHVVLSLDRPAAEVVSAAAERGVGLFTVDRYYAGPPTMNALVIGYGGISLTNLRRAVRQLRPLLPD